MIKKSLCALLASLSLTLSPSTGNGYDVSDRYLTRNVVRNLYESTTKVYSGKRIDLLDGTSTVEISSGSGVYLCDKKTKKRYILTSDHIFPVDKNSSFYITSANTKITKYGRDQEKDLALLETDSKDHVCLDGKIGTDYQIGDFVLLSGFYGGPTIMLREGRIASRIENKVILFQADVRRGDSGGPVISLDYGETRLVGITTFLVEELPRTNGAVTGDQICEFLQGSPVHDDYCNRDLKGEVKK